MVGLMWGEEVGDWNQTLQLVQPREVDHVLMLGDETEDLVLNSNSV